jgi:hypothetical protein
VSGRGTVFSETMTGSVRLAGESEPRAVRLDLTVRTDGVLLPHRSTEGRATGRIRIADWADDPHVQGELEISPLARHRIRYRLDFTAQGRYTLDGWKSVSLLRPVTSLTVLPFTLLVDGVEAGQGTLRFPATTGLLPFLASFRFPRPQQSTEWSLRGTAHAEVGDR